ncbi:hypothetical protein F2P81_008979 [Scophthalmus maximus]|uniref:Uncharacterized protein n=1 Tax=Scophthalmus maximus TaxID=52904 RepID=A0A6A4T0C6_SCOMX|nr:hypothetical protein F2P81_008979 [Scophthalmus maximus]
MSEGDVTVLPLAPASLDLSRQEPRTLTRLYCQGGGHHLRISPDGTQTLNDECYFVEKYEENHYNTYCSQKYNWQHPTQTKGAPIIVLQFSRKNVSSMPGF